MRQVVLGLGSNLGPRLPTLVRAARSIAQLDGVAELARSPVYQTAPVGGPHQPAYLNAALLIASSLPAEILLTHTQAIEHELGRVRDPAERNAPRTIDIDVLWVEGERWSTERLTVPHPRLKQRAFALRPLLDVLPDATDEDGPWTELPAAAEALELFVGSLPLT